MLVIFFKENCNLYIWKVESGFVLRKKNRGDGEILTMSSTTGKLRWYYEKDKAGSQSSLGVFVDFLICIISHDLKILLYHFVFSNLIFRAACEMQCSPTQCKTYNVLLECWILNALQAGMRDRERERGREREKFFRLFQTTFLVNFPSFSFSLSFSLSPVLLLKFNFGKCALILRVFNQCRFPLEF
jgi:hypothetical protein